MTDLTEQMKKGELPEGWYYVKDGENIIAELLDGYFYNDGQPMTSFSGGVDEVLDKVPSYEEWQASENYIDYLKQCISVYESKDKQATETSIAYNELLEENEKLKERNESLNNRDINLCRIANGIRDENFALKELLRECESLFNRSTVDGEEPTNGELIMILTKIEEVLK